MKKSVYWPKDRSDGYFDRALQRHFRNKDDKRRFLKEHNIIENYSMEDDRKRRKRLVDEINYHREKEGLKPKTQAELEGDARDRARREGGY